MNSKIEKIDDRALLERIRMRVSWDIRVSNSDISISVVDGCVTLFGYFDKTYRRAAAISVITSTDGVLDFNDQSQVVDDYYRTDREIESLIDKQLLTLPLLDGEWIEVDVCDGVVKLEGQVFRSRFKAFAARTAWELSGVKDCVNMIELKDWSDTMSALSDYRQRPAVAVDAGAVAERIIYGH